MCAVSIYGKRGHIVEECFKRNPLKKATQEKLPQTKTEKEQNYRGKFVKKKNIAKASVNLFLFLYCSSISDSPKSLWLKDSGCSAHMCHSLDCFTNFNCKRNDALVSLGNNSKIPICGSRDVIITIGKHRAILKDVMYVQDLMENFICPKINRVRDLIGMYNLKNNIPVAKLTAKSNQIYYLGETEYICHKVKRN